MDITLEVRGGIIVLKADSTIMLKGVNVEVIGSNRIDPNK